MAQHSTSWKFIIGIALAAAVGIAAIVVVALDPAWNEQGDDPATWTSRTRAAIAAEHEAAGQAISSNDLDKARLILEGLVKKYPADAQSHVMLAQVLMYENKAADALAMLTRALELDRGQPEVHYSAGILHERMGNFDKARFHYTQAATHDPSNASYPMHLGQLLMKMGELDAAQMQILKAQKLDSKLVQTYAVLAEISARRGKVSMAVELAGKALEQVGPEDPRRVTYALLKSQYLRRDNQPELALEVLRQLPPSEQMSTEVVRHIADSYLMMNEPAKAATVWSELFTVDPHNAQAAAQSGLAWVRAGDLSKARQMLGLASRVNGNDPAVLALQDAIARAK